MRITQTRTASILLAFGFFFITSCSTQVHTVDTIRTQHLEGDARKALASTNQLLRDDPENGQLLYLKAGILNDLAEALENPADRFDYYREMRQSLDQMPDTVPPALSAGSRNLIVTAWEREQREAMN